MSRATALTSAPLGALLDGLVDYAGLFPPAALAMAEAVRAYDGHRRGTESWALGRFVLPVSRLDELIAVLASLEDTGEPWRLAVLGTAGDAAAIAAFNTRHASRACIDTLEARIETVADVRALAAAGMHTAAAHPSLAVYAEVPLVADPGPLIAAIGASGLRAKVRTGGVTPEAFPAAPHVARFLRTCATYGVAFKATAGLHHAVRGEYRVTYDAGSPHATMFGFLNLFFAAMLLHAGLDDAVIISLLEERDARAFTFSDEVAAWRGHAVSAADVGLMRRLSAASFGSCSFAEPMHELATIGVL